MVAAAVHLPAPQGPAAHPQAVLALAHFHAERAQAGGHGRDAVAFLDPQLRRVPQGRLAPRRGRGDQQRRQLVYGQGHRGGGDIDAMQGSAIANAQIGLRLARFVRVPRLRIYIRAHGPQQADDGMASGIHAHAGQQQVGPRHDARRDKKKRRRGNIARHPYRRRPQGRPLHGDGGAVNAHRAAETRQHALGVIAAGRGLDDRGFAVGVEPGQQQGRLHLRAGDGHRVTDAAQGRRRPHPHRHRAGRARGDGRAHQVQRLGHPPHRSPPQRGVAGQVHVEILRRQHAEQQSRRGAGIAAIYGRRRHSFMYISRRSQTMHADAARRQALVPPFNLHAESPQGMNHGAGVGAIEKAMDATLPLRQRREQHGAVADGLVARHRDLPAQGPGRRFHAILNH